MSGARSILGINSAGFNTSCLLLVDGQPVFAVEEERLLREKRTRAFPSQGIKAALRWADLELTDVDAIAVAWNPAINLEAPNIAQTQRARYLGEIYYSVPAQLMGLAGALAGTHSYQKITLSTGKELNIYYVNHHLCHAANFFVSPFDEAAILSVDAFGEKDCVQFAVGRENCIERLWSQEFPHSLGSFYSTLTSFLGFKTQSDEWKLMGASAYGDGSRFYDRVRSLIREKDGGGFELDLAHFNHYQFHRPGLVTESLAQHLGIAPLPSGHELKQEHYDLAAAAQTVLEEVYLSLLRQLQSRPTLKNVVIAGGVVPRQHP